MKCSCGAEFKTELEYKIHYLIGRPNIYIVSRLTGTTEKQAKESEKRRREYDSLHQRGDLNVS